jgi:hypothetical protein
METTPSSLTYKEILAYYNMPIHRIVCKLYDSRDEWHRRALEYQKTLQANRIKIRDLSESRDKWRTRFLEEEEQTRSLQAENAALRAELAQKDQRIAQLEQDQDSKKK